jgi:hypothetical protein
VKRFASIMLVSVALPLFAAPARAEDEETMTPPPFGENAPSNYRSPQRFAIDLRFGPYSPNIDASPGLNGNHPFADLFPPAPGKSRPPGRLLTELEFDYEFLHKWWGTLGVGATAGFYRRSSHSFAYPDGGNTTVFCQNTATSPCIRTGDTTSLSIIPLSLLAIYKFDYLANRWSIPFIPYFKMGLGYYFWWIENGGGTFSVAQYTPPGSTASQGGWGGTLGWIMEPGGALLLDVLDPTAARTMDAELGINHTYLFCAFKYAVINGLGGGGKMNLSDNTLNAGLGFEF